MGKIRRIIYDFAFKRHLPAWFGLWGLLSIPLAIMLVLFIGQFLNLSVNTIKFQYSALVLIPLLLGLARLLQRPTHVSLTQDGICLCWKRTLVFTGKVLPWEEIREIKIVQPENTSRVQSRQLVFQGLNRNIILKIDEVVDVSVLPAMYDMIMARAGDVPRDPELQSMLGADQSHTSYTELWLKALTAPPERSRLAPLSVGTELQSGEYVVLERIGAGGQGVAYTATRKSDGQTVVLKEYVLPVGVSHGSKVDSLEKFQREAQILSQIEHPQIVKLIDFFFEDHRGYMVLEHVSGISLSLLVNKSGPLPVEQVIDLAKQMAQIQTYLHTREPAIIHRDFTPDNLILEPGGKLKLIDFNVAQQKKSTATATVVGKHSYIAPDQFRGNVSAQSDIYSLGASLFFLLTAADPKPISVQHPRLKNEAVSEELDSIVAKCTAIDPEMRYTEASALHSALEELKVLA
jgi:hypothetical protein